MKIFFLVVVFHLSMVKKGNKTIVYVFFKNNNLIFFPFYA